MIFDTLRLPEVYSDDYMVATYSIRSQEETNLYEWVKLIAADQSVGTWTHVEGETPEVIERYGAKVVGIYTIEKNLSCVARIAFPIENVPSYMAMILSTVAGNVLGQDGIKLMDLELPKKMLNYLPGPLMGIEGIRERLNIKEGPLVGAILKPCLGVTPDVSAAGVKSAALGGADVIKDDELLSYPEYSPMEVRVKSAMRELVEIGKEKTCLYAVNITGENLFDRARRAIDAGANALMVNYQSMGWGAVEDFIRQMKRENLIYPIFGHCAGLGAYYRSPNTGISTELVCGKLARLIGMDMPLVYPDSGRFGLETNELIATHVQCVSELYNIKQSFMTVAGGVHPGKIDYLMNLLGNNCILMAGGGIYGHPMGAEAGARAIKYAIEAKVKGIALDNLEYDEIKLAIKQWGNK